MSSLLNKLDKEAAELKRKLQVKSQLNVVVAKQARQGGGRAQEKATGKDATECRRCSISYVFPMDQITIKTPNPKGRLFLRMDL